MDLLHFIFETLHTIKLYHWSTKRYADHIATDALHTFLAATYDRVVEMTLGRKTLVIKPIRLTIQPLTHKEMVAYLKKAIKYLSTDPIFSQSSDITNLRDEIVGEMHKTLYLLQLK